MDLNILLEIQNHLSHPLLDEFFIHFTHLGDKGLLWILLCLVLLLRRKTRTMGWLALACLITEFTLNDLILKPLIQRSRPFIDFPYALLIPAPSGFSFPSGHAASSFAVATSLFLSDRKNGRWALVLAGLMAFSRLYLFVHYPSDVLVGSLLGILVAFFIHRLYRQAIKKNQGQKA